MSKLKSRKFWLTVAMLCGSVATAITGMSTENEMLAVIGVICGAAAGCIYNICEAMVDSYSVTSGGESEYEYCFDDEESEG